MQNSLPKRIHDDRNGLDYILQGDYYFPVIDDPSETRPIGRWGRMHRRYLEENRPTLYHQLVLKGTIKTYLADLNEQAQQRLETIIHQMKKNEGVTEQLKMRDQIQWVRQMNSIRQRAEEIIADELIYT